MNSLRLSHVRARNSDHEASSEQQQQRRRLESTNDDELEELFRRNERTMIQLRRDLALAQRETFGEPPPEPPTSTDQSSGSDERPAALLSTAHDSNLDRGEEGGKLRGDFMSQRRGSNAFDTPTLDRRRGTEKEKEGVPWCPGKGEGRFMIEANGRERGRDTSDAVRSRLAPRDSLMRVEPPLAVELLARRLERGRFKSTDDGDEGRLESCSEREIGCPADGGFEEPDSCTSCYPMSSSPRHVCLPLLSGKLSTPEVNSCSSSRSTSRGSISSVVNRDGPLLMRLRSRDEDGLEVVCYDRQVPRGVNATAARCRRAAHATKSYGNHTAETDPEAVVKTLRRNDRANEGRSNQGPGGRSSPVPRGVNEGHYGKPGGCVTVVAPNVRDILMSAEEFSL